MSWREMVVMLALAPSTVLAQPLGHQIERVREGTVRLTYAARPGLCGDGREAIRSGSSFIVLPSNIGYGRSDRTDICFAGPVRVAIGRRDGESVSYRVHVGGRWNPDDDATDLGMVPSREA